MNAGDLTLMLNQAKAGDLHARSQLLELVYDQLQQIARQRLQRNSPDIQATELVHEAYLNLFGNQTAAWESRHHFFGVAAQTMRRLLIDFARAQKAQKRGGDRIKITYADDILLSDLEMDCDELLDLNEAIEQLHAEDELLSKVVQLRFFAGQSMESIAEALSLSLSSTERKWRLARAFLVNKLGGRTKGEV